MPSSECLVERIHARIVSSGGAIPLTEFMELALYDPEDGYYTSGRVQFGKGGDFFTSPTVSRLFGEAIARYLAPALRSMLRPLIVELGPGDGHLARDLLGTLKEREPDLYENCKYVLVERSPALQQRQVMLLREHQSRLLFLKDTGRLEAPECAIIANEFFDAFPARRWQWSRAMFHEWMVALDGDRCTWTLRTVNSDEAPAIVREVAQAVEEGTLDLPVGISEVLDDLWGRVQEGLFLIIDYGDTVLRLAVRFPDGTLRAQSKHAITADIFQEPGTRDLSIFVPVELLLSDPAYPARLVDDVNSLKTGETYIRRPLTFTYFETQAEFLMKTTFPEVLESILALPPGEEKFRLQMQARTLVNPEGIGGAMFALVLATPAFRDFLPHPE
ncbi:MAG: SAM-dependent methyltransferase [bacterium JZ-2024 1]